eukprot:1141594-Pelagomonas_calceolata.AAC.2
MEHDKAGQIYAAVQEEAGKAMQTDRHFSMNRLNGLTMKSVHQRLCRSESWGCKAPQLPHVEWHTYTPAGHCTNMTTSV